MHKEESCILAFFFFFCVYSGGSFPQKWKFCFAVGDVSAGKWWSEGTEVLKKESKSN